MIKLHMRNKKTLNYCSLNLLNLPNLYKNENMLPKEEVWNLTRLKCTDLLQNIQMSVKYSPNTPIYGY